MLEVPPIPPVFHGSWFEGHFFLWAENSEPAPKPRGRRSRLMPHPHAAAPKALRARLAKLLPDGDWDGPPDALCGVFLPSRGDAPLLPPWLAPVSTAEDDVADRGEPVKLAPWKVPGLLLEPLTALDLLIALPTAPGDRRIRDWGDDLRYWSAVAKFGLELLARQSYLPGLTEDNGRYRAVWLPIWDTPQDHARLKLLAEACPPVARALFDAKSEPDPAQAPAPHALLEDFLKALVDVAVRDWGRAHLDRRRKSPTGVAGTWWDALWAPEGSLVVTAKERRDLSALHEAWRGWLAQLRGTPRAS